jgi:hypothetical protein
MLAIGLILIIIGSIEFLFTFPLVLYNIVFPIPFLSALLCSLGLILAAFGIVVVIAAIWELYRRRG